nr:hypothetical protein [Actinomycetota bacterium]
SWAGMAPTCGASVLSCMLKRQSFLSLLRAGYEDYVINDEALRYMRERQLAGPVIEMLRAHPVRSFPNEAAWRAHLSALGIDTLSATPPAVTIATEGALWGAIRHHGVLSHTVIVSDDAGQFRLGTHALCRVGGDVAIPAPHRPGRADFPHPVLQERALLPTV